MANVDIANGFNPTGMIYGLGRYALDASTSTASFRNDLMMMISDGNVEPATANQTVTLGSLQGTTSASTAQKALVAASTAATVLISAHPDQRYIAQDDASDTSAETYIGNNADIVAGSGNTTTGLSGHEIASSDKKSATAQIRLIDIQRRGDNAFGANADWLCRINEHFYATTTGV